MKLADLAITAFAAFVAVHLHSMGESSLVALPVAIAALLFCYALRQSRTD